MADINAVILATSTPAELAAEAKRQFNIAVNLTETEGSDDPEVRSAIACFRATIDTLTAATRELAAPAVPEGWKLVPIELTEAMWDAYYVNIARTGLPCTWQLMLAAAPHPSAQPARDCDLYAEGNDADRHIYQPAEPKELKDFLPIAANWIEMQSAKTYGACLIEHTEAANWLRDDSVVRIVSNPNVPTDQAVVVQGGKRVGTITGIGEQPKGSSS